jgi:uncharacterized membrane protein YbhN (UPF0104 family)
VEEAPAFGEERLTAILHRLSSRRWQTPLSWLVAAGLLAWLAAQADLGAIKASLNVTYPGWLAAAVLSVIATVVVRVARWRALLRGMGGTYPAWSPLWRATLWGQGLNWLLPVRAGDLARAYGIRHAEWAGQASVPADVKQPQPVGAPYALGTIGAEKLLDLAWLCLALLPVLLFERLPTLSELLPAAHIALPLLVLGGALTLAWLLSRATSSLGQDRAARPWPRWEAAADGVQRLGAGLAVLSRPAALWPALAWSLLLWLGHVFNNYATARALALPMNWLGATLVLVVLQAGLVPPSTPAKIGVFQALCVAGLGLLGFDVAASLAYGLVLQWVVMIPPLLLWLVDLLLGRGAG